MTTGLLDARGLEINPVWVDCPVSGLHFTVCLLFVAYTDLVVSLQQGEGSAPHFLELRPVTTAGDGLSPLYRKFWHPKCIVLC